MIEFFVQYPNSDEQGSWAFVLLPHIGIHYDGKEKYKAFEIGWLFWALCIVKHEE